MFAFAATASAFAALPAAAQDIKFGANLPMSGPNAEYGELFSRAAAIAVEHARNGRGRARASMTMLLVSRRKNHSRPGDARDPEVFIAPATGALRREL